MLHVLAFKQRTLAEAARDTTKLNTEAEASRRRTLAEADAEAAKNQAVGQSEAAKSEADGAAYAQRTVASAEAEAINVRADALQGDNQALIAANKLVDLLPGLVEAAATGLSGSNLTILNGADGVTQLIAGLVGQGLSIYETLRPSIAGNGDRGDRADLGTQTSQAGRAISDPRRPHRSPASQPQSIPDPSASHETV